MCLLVRKSLAALLLCFSIFIASSPIQALEGGQSARPTDYPGLVVLSYDEIPSTIVDFKNCTGIVLEPRRILTSVRCVFTLGPFGLSIPASKIHVHPVPDGEIGGVFLLPVVQPSLTPNIRVSSYTVHPQNPSPGGPYNLVILNLAGNINLTPASVYNGTNRFAGSTGTAIGWKEEPRGLPRIYVLNKSSFPLVDGDTNISGLCYDNSTDTNTVFCGGFRNSTKFLESHDQGAPIYRTINGKNTAIGVLSNPSFGTPFAGVFPYETYARISSMVSFIRQHAPNTQFWNESGTGPEAPIVISPIIQLLLLDGDS